MPRHRAVRHLLLSIAPILLAVLVASAQTPQSTLGSEPAPITMEQEHHHHVVFENAYVKVVYVEIPPHESTLYHRHDLPYLSFPPPSLADLTPPSTNGHSLPAGPHVSYAVGGFSHTVTNTSDITLRNIAIELLRPQGTVRNRCAEVLRGQPLNDCDKPAASSTTFPVHYTLFETDGIAVEDWEIAPGSTISPADARVSTLVGAMNGISDVTGGGDSRMVPQAGLLWLLADSKATLKAGPDATGHFVMIRFKDSVRPESAP